MDRRDSGSPRRVGSSQASALISTTTPGGKDSGTPAPGPFLQTRHPGLKEASAPLTHHFPPGVQACGDLVVAQALSDHEDRLGTNHISIR